MFKNCYVTIVVLITVVSLCASGCANTRTFSDWEIAELGDTIRSYEHYLEIRPSGPHAAHAKQRISNLKQEDMERAERGRTFSRAMEKENPVKARDRHRREPSSMRQQAATEFNKIRTFASIMERINMCGDSPEKSVTFKTEGADERKIYTFSSTTFCASSSTDCAKTLRFSLQDKLYRIKNDKKVYLTDDETESVIAAFCKKEFPHTRGGTDSGVRSKPNR